MMIQPRNDFSRVHGPRTCKNKGLEQNESDSIGDNESKSPGNTRPQDLCCYIQAADVLDISCVLKIWFGSHRSGQVWTAGKGSSCVGENAPFPCRAAKALIPVECDGCRYEVRQRGHKNPLMCVVIRAILAVVTGSLAQQLVELSRPPTGGRQPLMQLPVPPTSWYPRPV